MTFFSKLFNRGAASNPFERIRAEIVGIDLHFDGPMGRKHVVYADWIASGRLYRPMPHMAAVAFVDPATQAYPALQFPLHVGNDCPGVSPNTPAGQSAHCPAPDRLYRPTPHMVAVALVDPATHAYPALQFPLHVSAVTPVADP